MITRDDLPDTPEWQMPRRCCATWTTELACGVCGEWVSDTPPAHIWLGEN